MATHTTYANTLLSKGHGHALWEPDPGECAPVDLGDVGYLYKGAFVKLFNASKDRDDWSNRLGLPTGHIPLNVGEVLRKAPLQGAPKYISSGGISQIGADLNIAVGASAQAGSNIGFECSRKQGAMLIMGDVANRADALNRKQFCDYIIKHHRSWLDFADSLGRDLSLSDLILVDGCDKTSEWACAAWSEKTQSVRLSFLAGAPGFVGGGVSFWGQWESSQSVDENVGPPRLSQSILLADHLSISDTISVDEIHSLQTAQSISPTLPPSNFNQCVFVRGWRIGDRSTWFKRKTTLVDLGDGFTTILMPSDSKMQSDKESTARRFFQRLLCCSKGARRGDTSRVNANPHGSKNSSRSPRADVDNVSDGYSNSDDSTRLMDLNFDSRNTPAAAMIGYILENSSADIALIHDDDISDLLRSDRDVHDYNTWIRQLSPSVYLVENVGMYAKTYHLHNLDDPRMHTDLPNDLVTPQCHPDPNLDHFSAVTAPPVGETDIERTARLAKEVEKRRINELIDEALNQERLALKKAKNVVKVLLLGQSESGKSATLKNFRLRFAPQAWRAEHSSWRAVVQLNIICSVNTILDALNEPSSIPTHSNMYGAHESFIPSIAEPLKFTEKHRLLKLKLAPIRRIEADLKRHLGMRTEEVELPSISVHRNPPDVSLLTTNRTPRRCEELAVKSWKYVLERNKNALLMGAASGSINVADNAAEMMAECKNYMKEIWEDEVVQDALETQRIILADSAGFFLGDLDRIATRSYEPSDDDVVRARLRTVGVQEHRIKFEEREWVFYDVGGARTSRAAWLPYFTDVVDIIFLAPISCFDERLVEDPDVNRLEDSFILWDSICSSKLLVDVGLTVFLNKCDLLEKKLQNGVKIRTHLTSYGDRPNDTATFIKYIKHHFLGISSKFSHSRPVRIIPTCVTDTMAMATILSSVRDSILIQYLRRANTI